MTSGLSYGNWQWKKQKKGAGRVHNPGASALAAPIPTVDGSAGTSAIKATVQWPSPLRMIRVVVVLSVRPGPLTLCPNFILGLQRHPNAPIDILTTKQK